MRAGPDRDGAGVGVADDHGRFSAEPFEEGAGGERVDESIGELARDARAQPQRGDAVGDKVFAEPPVDALRALVADEDDAAGLALAGDEHGIEVAVIGLERDDELPWRIAETGGHALDRDDELGLILRLHGHYLLSASTSVQRRSVRGPRGASS